MTDPEAVDRLRGLFQDLCAYTDSRLQNVDRLWQELEATIDDFRLLLDKPPKNDTSRRAVLSGTSQSLPLCYLFILICAHGRPTDRISRRDHPA